MSKATQTATSFAVGAFRLSGTLPPGVGNLSNLTTVNLAGNDLSGFLPSSWGEMINLNSL